MWTAACQSKSMPALLTSMIIAFLGASQALLAGEKGVAETRVKLEQMWSVRDCEAVPCPPHVPHLLFQHRLPDPCTNSASPVESSMMFSYPSFLPRTSQNFWNIQAGQTQLVPACARTAPAGSSKCSQARHSSELSDGHKQQPNP